MAQAARTPKTRAPGLRRCLVERASVPRAGLIRFVRDGSGAVVPDPAEILPGRGWWVTARRAAIESAVRKRLFATKARSRAIVPADLADRVERCLVARCSELIARARRAGEIDFIPPAAGSGSDVVPLLAADAASPAAADRRGLAVLDRAELAAATGRRDIVWIGVRPGRLATALARDTARLAGFRPRS